MAGAEKDGRRRGRIRRRGGRGRGVVTLQKQGSSPHFSPRVLIKTGILYEKGQIAQINFGAYNRRFKVKRSFVLHGTKNGDVVVTVPVSLGTLKGLGFIGSVKGE